MTAILYLEHLSAQLNPFSSSRLISGLNVARGQCDVTVELELSAVPKWAGIRRLIDDMSTNKNCTQ
ncbi:hypothetical protein VM1G_11769 [Cytospora mali]|uniref:Uncharacterized protein n=1 Tax=Cytospora mali TaxID=578113 RepID=A0A194W5C6_CYTMA|nr:hypothetical protein VM1G_11769 [Valsa mali]